MRALVPLMTGRRASIVNVASGLGLVGADMTAYCASKGGLVLLTKAAAIELGPRSASTRSAPASSTRMPAASRTRLRCRAGAALELASPTSPGGIGTPEEVVAAAVFLASDEASFITGAAIPVDSGVTAR